MFPATDSAATPLRAAVIGAGLAGLTCARELRRAGLEVTVFEQSPAVGGRLATRWTEIGGFDHGAQYCVARSGAFSSELEDWQRAGVVAAWDAMLVARPERRAVARPGTPRRYVGVPGMSAIAEHLSAGLDVRLERRIDRLERIMNAPHAGWTLKRAADPKDPSALELTEGIYDRVVVAVPSPSAAQLLTPVPELVLAARNVQFSSCWSLMLGFSEVIDVHFDGAVIAGPRLEWIARDSLKPGRRVGERWIAHADGRWSAEHAADDPADVRVKLIKAFMEATGAPIQPIYADVYRWHHAKPIAPLPAPYLWDARSGLGACGDWCGGATLEHAWLSAMALAREIRTLGVAPERNG